MYLLNHIPVDQAQGELAHAYSIFPNGVPVPEPLIMMSASPELAQLQSKIISYFMTQSRMESQTMAALRYILATRNNYAFCMRFNAHLLQFAAGFTPSELESMAKDPATAPLEPEQKQLLLFVLKVVDAPQDVTKNDVDELREMGFSDTDIFDAAYHAASFIVPTTLFKAFVKEDEKEE
ncbi:hypothetical protein [Desulfovibrio inopinatus]|uniref:hypothetical protein n=1 Tax=Desulfovibrio inopinatus TaxID=102109 RepID=UPI000426CABF|nr:hypothetical protein [Desulfovibrio inopinatus]